MALDNYIKRYSTVSAVIDMLCRKELVLLDPQTWDDRNDRYFMALYKEDAEATGLYAACFTQSDETYHHWRVYGGGSDGACVEFNRVAFEAHIAGNPDIRAGEVEYFYLGQIEKLATARRKDIPFFKRMGFGPEEEYRVVAKSRDSQTPALSLPINLALINKIYLNPWLPDSVYDSLKSIMKSVDGCDHIVIARSRLIDSLRWKNAGNKLVGKPKMGRMVLAAGSSKPAKPQELSKRSKKRKKRKKRR